MKKLFELPELVTLDGRTVTGDDESEVVAGFNGGGCGGGCTGGCNTGCNTGGWQNPINGPKNCYATQ